MNDIDVIDYQNLRTNEIMEEERIYFIVDDYLECSKQACMADFIQAEDSGALNWVRNLVEAISDKSLEGLFIEGLDRYTQNRFRDSLFEIAKNCNIDIQVLINAILIRAVHYRNIERYLNNRPVTLDEFEGVFLSEGKFSRSELEKWELYVYLASLFLKRGLN